MMKGDFLGFTYGNSKSMLHSSAMNIVRTSDGGRFNINLSPSIKDTSSEINGRDGMLYFGTNYKSNTIGISFAFDSLTESQLRQLKALFSEKGIHKLIFDEDPYKIYYVRPTGNPTIKCISFDKNNSSFDYIDKDELYGVVPPVLSARVYKGEGNINFSLCEPYARSRYKFIEDYTSANISEWAPEEGSVMNYYNILEWNEAARLISKSTTKNIGIRTYTIDTPQITNNSGAVLIYNPGDCATSFNYTVKCGNVVPSITLQYNHDGSTYGNLIMDEVPLEVGDEGYRVNNELHLIEGMKLVTSGGTTKLVPSGIIYNRYIKQGDFFNIAPTTEPEFIYIFIQPSSTSGSIQEQSIEYNYKYF